MERDYIIAEIKRTAALNGGKPLGRLRLESEAGIKMYHWQKHWPRYNGALQAAGFVPNAKTVAYNQDEVLQKVADLARRLERFPTTADIITASHDGSGLPTAKTIMRPFGSKAKLVSAVADFCDRVEGYADVAAHCAEARPTAAAIYEETTDTAAPLNDGFVYLIKAGRFYKIGKTNHVGRRERELSIQLPEPAKTIHSIRTDDPDGIEAYWHRRFADKRKNGEWFDLTRQDVATFRRRKFM
jgi:hypothetical protein